VRNLSSQGQLVFYTSLAHALVHALELTYAALLLRIGDEFDQGKFMLGIIAQVGAFAFGASALPGGALVDRLGAQRVLFFCFLGAAFGALLVGLSPNEVFLGAFLALLGLAVGLYHPAGLALIAQGATRRGIALGYHGVAGNIGIALAPAIAVGFSAAFGWRSAYFFLAALALALAVVLRLIRLPTPAAAAPVPAAARAESDRRPRSVTLLPLLLVYLAFVLNGFIYRGSITFLPTHIEEQVHLSVLGIDEKTLAGCLTTVALLMGAGGQYLGGSLSQRYPLERLAPLIAITLVPVLLLMGVSSGLALVAVSGVFIFFNFSAQPVYTGLIADYSPEQALGRSYGISFFAAFGLGSSAATFSGFFAERFGTSSVFLTLGGFATLSVALAIAIWRLAVTNKRRAIAASEGRATGYDGPGGPM
jgi:MFS family permease